MTIAMARELLPVVCAEAGIDLGDKAALVYALQRWRFVDEVERSTFIRAALALTTQDAEVMKEVWVLEQACAGVAGGRA